MNWFDFQFGSNDVKFNTFSHIQVHTTILKPFLTPFMGHLLKIGKYINKYQNGFFHIGNFYIINSLSLSQSSEILADWAL
jgi:hypothetical protein